ncbi:hypothetical protein J5751_00485 [bacterium]|nr:hypothetical protein [bacterium]
MSNRKGNVMKIIVPFNAPLHELDTEDQTYGCRKNPSICANNGIPNICALVSDDCICKKPSAAWKKKYNELKEKK